MAQSRSEDISTRKPQCLARHAEYGAQAPRWEGSSLAEL
jgi:hypothetical protein